MPLNRWNLRRSVLLSTCHRQASYQVKQTTPGRVLSAATPQLLYSWQLGVSECQPHVLGSRRTGSTLVASWRFRNAATSVERLCRRFRVNSD
jgi:hypothetical protein